MNNLELKKMKTEVNNDFYRPLPFFKKVVKKLKDVLKNIKTSFKNAWKRLLIFLIILILLALIIMIAIFSKTEVLQRSEYDKTGFTNALVNGGIGEDSKNYFTENNIPCTVFENNNYKFVFDNVLTTFTLYDLVNGSVWESNPSGASTKYLNPIILNYKISLGAQKSLGVYDNAIKYNTYSLRVIDNSIEVLYNVGGKKEYDKFDFPQAISKQRMEDLVLKNISEDDPDYNNLLKYFTLSTIEGEEIYTLKSIGNKKKYKELYQMMYGKGGYTIEDLKVDASIHGFEIASEYPYFEIAIKYTLTNQGLVVDVINDSVYESNTYPLLYVDVLPMFGCARNNEVGYCLIPDGSGVVIDYNNPRSFATPYNQRIYGNDLSRIKNEKANDQENIMFPMYGVVKENKGFINIVTSGEGLTSIICNTYRTGAYDYNQAYYRYFFRENESYEFSSLSNTAVIIEWTKQYSKVNFTSLITGVKDYNDSTITYYDMAKSYQEYLVNNNLLNKSDQTTDVCFDLTLIGGYVEEKNFIGFQYEKVNSLTSVNEAIEILDKLQQSNVSNINVVYKGWMNDGLDSTYNGKLNINKVTGSKKEFRTLSSYANDARINLFPEVNVFKVYTNKQINEQKKATRNVFGKVVSNKDYNQSTYYRNSKSKEYYILKPSTYVDTLNNINKYYSKLGFKNIAFNDLASYNYGSYQPKDVIFRTDQIDYAINALNGLNGIYNKTLFTKPFDYSLQFATNIVEAPISGTNYQIVSYSVPFYQLVLNGYVDYSTSSFNLNDKYDYNYHMLKALETISNIGFTWSYKNTLELIDTLYNKYYATCYLNKYDEVISLYNYIKSMDVHKLTIANHQVLSPDGLITKTTYSNGQEIIFNFSTSPKVVEGIEIEAMGYVSKGGIH